MFIIGSIILFYVFEVLNCSDLNPWGLPVFHILLPTTPGVHGGVREHFCG